MSYVEDISFVFGNFLCAVHVLDADDFGNRRNGAVVLPMHDLTRAFAQISVHKPLDVDYELLIEVAWSSPLGPRILVQAEKGRVYIGYDVHVCCVDLNTRSLLQDIELKSLLWELLPIGENLICLHELGAFCLASDGNKIWEIDLGDVLTDFGVADGLLRMQGEECEKWIDLASGKIVREE
jgi:hypothetical protein